VGNASHQIELADTKTNKIKIKKLIRSVSFKSSIDIILSNVF